MPAVTAEELAAHLNIVEPDAGTLTYLADLSATAEAVVFAWTGPFPTADDPPVQLPAPVRHAIMMLAAHLFANREAASPDHLNEIPFGFHDLISPWRKWGC